MDNNDDKKEQKISWKELLKEHLANNPSLLPKDEETIPWNLNREDMGLPPLSPKSLIILGPDNSGRVNPEDIRAFFQEAKELINNTPASGPTTVIDWESILPSNGDDSQWNVSNQPLDADGKLIEFDKIIISETSNGSVWEKFIPKIDDEKRKLIEDALKVKVGLSPQTTQSLFDDFDRLPEEEKREILVKIVTVNPPKSLQEQVLEHLSAYKNTIESVDRTGSIPDSVKTKFVEEVQKLRDIVNNQTPSSTNKNKPQ